MAKDIFKLKGSFTKLGQYQYKNFLYCYPEFKARFAKSLNLKKKNIKNPKTVQKQFNLYITIVIRYGVFINN